MCVTGHMLCLAVLLPTHSQRLTAALQDSVLVSNRHQSNHSCGIIVAMAYKCGNRQSNMSNHYYCALCAGRGMKLCLMASVGLGVHVSSSTYTLHACFEQMLDARIEHKLCILVNSHLLACCVKYKWSMTPRKSFTIG